jgi:hypothetical protein
MRKYLDRLAYRVQLWGIEKNEVGRFDGIGFAHLRWRDDSQESFRKTMEESLQLVQEHDPQRYVRIKRYIKWIVNRVTDAPMGAEYVYRVRTCNIEFVVIPDLAPHLTAAFWAAILVHEATHGVFESRGIPYAAQSRVRIERLCTAEQNRFAAHLEASDPARFPLARLDFDEECWHGSWAASRSESRTALLSRWFADMKAERTKIALSGARQRRWAWSEA